MSDDRQQQHPTALTDPPAHADPVDTTEDGATAVPVPAVELDLPHEVEARSADTDKPGTAFRKVFIVGRIPGDDFTASGGYDHEPNKAATRQYAIAAGLWPTADVKFVSKRKHDDGVSTVLTYSVEVAPAHRVADGSDHPEVVDQQTGDSDKAANAEQPTGDARK